MAATVYLLQLPNSNTAPSRTLRDNVDAVAVNANSQADAVAFVKSQFGDDVNSMWDIATASTPAAAADLTGWQARVRVVSPSGSVVVDVTVPAVAADTIDLFAPRIVTALNATPEVAGAAYDSTTQVLKVAETTDVLGDHRIFAYFIAPGSDPDELVGIPGFITAKTDAGLASAALTLTLAADAYVIPTVLALLGEVVA